MGIVCQIRDIKSRNLRWKKQEVLKKVYSV